MMIVIIVLIAVIGMHMNIVINVIVFINTPSKLHFLNFFIDEDTLADHYYCEDCAQWHSHLYCHSCGYYH